ncbi:antitoxin VapB [Arsukibacterium tuosuense]|uniref:Antitoxin VapB n=1 Tax=Arsukibacterium tuosuense TaxID=1323745 RepID=A0A285J2X9_9GAMM|nr:type II toxin-antitoxin system VapB family antitoxin [Arsukibacterium tuosuense]SNY54423.1 antitoxin VapB [Arsukibacterium tuosuense]
MRQGIVFTINDSQAVQLLVEAHFPDSVKKVTVRVVGKDRILTPVENSWDSFFLQSCGASDDFISERATQQDLEGT